MILAAIVCGCAYLGPVEAAQPLEDARAAYERGDYVEALRLFRLLADQHSFHILDPDWGHLTIKISGHPPFPAQVILNGHEYVACQARKAGVAFTKEGNCFTTISDAAGLAKIADTPCPSTGLWGD